MWPRRNATSSTLSPASSAREATVCLKECIEGSTPRGTGTDLPSVSTAWRIGKVGCRAASVRAPARPRALVLRCAVAGVCRCGSRIRSRSARCTSLRACAGRARVRALGGSAPSGRSHRSSSVAGCHAGRPAIRTRFRPRRDRAALGLRDLWPLGGEHQRRRDRSVPSQPPSRELVDPSDDRDRDRHLAPGLSAQFPNQPRHIVGGDAVESSRVEPRPKMPLNDASVLHPRGISKVEHRPV